MKFEYIIKVPYYSFLHWHLTHNDYQKYSTSQKKRLN